MAFSVPKEFVINASDVLAMGSPADVGKLLLDHLARRVGLCDLSNCEILDFGCGTRFTDSIINRRLPVKKYIGVDTNEKLIAFLVGNVSEPNLRYHYFNSFNPTYNQNGAPLTEDSTLPLETQQSKFDLVTMYSVITHQIPEDTFYIFRMLRRYIRNDGHMFFTAKIEGNLEHYREYFPDKPTAFSVYSLEFLAMLLRTSGWKAVSMLPALVDGLPMETSFVCAPISA